MKNKLENPNSIKNEIKGYIYASGWKMNILAKRLNNSKYAEQTFNNKLTNETIKYSEVKELADILGYDIKWEKRK